MNTTLHPIAKPVASPRFKFVSAEEVENQPPPSWLIPNLVVQGGLTVLYGAPGAGKSFAALDLIAIPAAKQGIVIYVAAEGQGGLGSRLKAAKLAAGVSATNLYFLGRPVMLDDPATVKKLMESIDEAFSPTVELKLIVIDTLARSLGGADENSATEVGKFISGIDSLRAKYGCAVLVLHHSAKRHNRVERGSGALRGAADTMIFLGRRSKDSVLLSCEKQKDAAPFPDMLYQLDVVTVGDGITSCVIQNRGTVLRPRPEDQLMLDAASTTIVCALRAAPRGLRFSELEKLLVRGESFSRTTLNRRLGVLKEAGHINHDGATYRLSDQFPVSIKCQDGVMNLPASSTVS